MVGGRSLSVVAVLVAVLVACGAAPDAIASERACAEVVLEDWGDGRVDGVYPTDCYLAAIEILPEDVRAYSTAVDDLSRALQARRVGEGIGGTARGLGVVSQPQAGSEATRSVRDVPVMLLVLAAIALLVALGGGAGFAARRFGERI
jgi:hypothetical protein